MKKNMFKLSLSAITILTAISCSKKDTIKPAPGTTLIKKTTQDSRGNLLSYSKLVYNNTTGKLDSGNTYDKNNTLSEYIAFKYNGTGNIDNIVHEDIKNSGPVTKVSFHYTNSLITTANKTDAGSSTADYTLTYDGNNRLTKVNMDNKIGADRINDITYDVQGKANKQTNSFFTGGTPYGAGFNISNDQEDAIEYLEYYPQIIKSLAPTLDNLIVKCYPKKMQVGTDIFYYETTFNELGNPTKTIKRLNDQNGAIQETTTYEYQ